MNNCWLNITTTSYCLIQYLNQVTFFKQKWLLQMFTNCISKQTQTQELVNNGSTLELKIQRLIGNTCLESWILQDLLFIQTMSNIIRGRNTTANMMKIIQKRIRIRIHKETRSNIFKRLCFGHNWVVINNGRGLIVIL